MDDQPFFYLVSTVVFYAIIQSQTYWCSIVTVIKKRGLFSRPVSHSMALWYLRVFCGVLSYHKMGLFS